MGRRVEYGSEEHHRWLDLIELLMFGKVETRKSNAHLTKVGRVEVLEDGDDLVGPEDEAAEDRLDLDEGAA